MSTSATMIIKKGRTFEKFIEFLNDDQTPVDLTGYSARGQIRSAPNGTLYCKFTDALGPDGTGLNMTPNRNASILPKSSGSIAWVISAYSSSQFNFNTAYYDIELSSGSGVSEYVVELLSGRIKCIEEITI